jgi:hypothetical protein
MNFDHLSNSQTQCSICAELRDLRHAHVSSQVGNDQKFSIIPSLGPLVLGHSLLVTRSHEKSVLLYGDAATWNEEVLPLLLAFMKQISEHKEEISFVLFEHGSTKPDSSLCSTSHAHLHIVPVDTDQIGQIKQAVEAQSICMPHSNLLSHCRHLENFIYTSFFLSGSLGTTACLQAAGDLQSQHMRRLIAGILHLRDWNWKLDPYSGLYKQTVDRIFKRDRFLEDSLPSRR